MNASQAGTPAAPVSLPWRLASLRVEGFPWIPTAILGVIALLGTRPGARGHPEDLAAAGGDAGPPGPVDGRRRVGRDHAHARAQRVQHVDIRAGDARVQRAARGAHQRCVGRIADESVLEDVARGGVATAHVQKLGVHQPRKSFVEGTLVAFRDPLGFQSVWGLEHHFTDYTMCPDVLQFLSYMAGRTTRASLGSMVVVLPWHDPMRVAEQVVMLDHMSNGRFVFGIGFAMVNAPITNSAVTARPSTVVFSVAGPVARADLPAICGGVAALLETPVNARGNFAVAGAASVGPAGSGTGPHSRHVLAGPHARPRTAPPGGPGRPPRPQGRSRTREALRGRQSDLEPTFRVPGP